MKGADAYYLSLKEPNKSTLLALQYHILKMDSDIYEILKYNIPCFIYKGKVLCYLWIDRKTNMPQLLLEEGKYLKHPKLKETTHKKIKSLEMDPNQDIDIENVKAILTQALDLFKNRAII